MNEMLPIPDDLTNKTEFFCNFIDGAYLEIKGRTIAEFVIEIICLDDPEFSLTCEISTNQWVRTPHRYFMRWQISVYEKTSRIPVFQERYDCKDKRVYIALESSALGDSLAWFPAVEQFRAAHGCQIICSTFFNGLFKDQYPEIEFVEPGETVNDLYALYRLGWYYNEDGACNYTQNVQDFKQQPVGQSAYDILGLDYVESKPRIKLPDAPAPLDKPYVCIGFHATAQAKYWNNPKGWDELIRFLRYKGYSVVMLSREGKQHMGNKIPNGVKCIPDGSLDIVINYLRHAKLFIGIGSGLSWLSWAAGCQTCLISGFSYPYSEMSDCIRIFPEGAVCTGCFNRYRLDQDDWLWCPDQKHTSNRFACTRHISGRQVIAAITPYL
ncbi:MAG: autotransporter strand-loop-strand O-heptosyltransferase [Methylococcales bacterium]